MFASALVCQPKKKKPYSFDVYSFGQSRRQYDLKAYLACKFSGSHHHLFHSKDPFGKKKKKKKSSKAPSFTKILLLSSDKRKLTLHRMQVACTNYDSISGSSSSISMATLFMAIRYYAAEYICTAFLGHFSLKCIYHSHLSPLFHLMTALDSIK